MKKHKRLRLECGFDALSYFAEKTRRKISEESHIYVYDKIHDGDFAPGEAYRSLKWLLELNFTA